MKLYRIVKPGVSKKTAEGTLRRCVVDDLVEIGDEAAAIAIERGFVEPVNSEQSQPELPETEPAPRKKRARAAESSDGGDQ
jgi:hypothetical protein